MTAAVVQDSTEEPRAQEWTPLATDRCDRCRAQAYVRTITVSGGELLWCAHDYKKHQDVLVSSGDSVQRALFVFDRTDILNAVA
jgi:hypothetical protein